MNTDKTLANMPNIGFGTYLIPNEEAQKTISIALKIGYRHIDTAEVYRNEVGIGLGLKTHSLNFLFKEMRFSLPVRFFLEIQVGAERQKIIRCVLRLVTAVLKSLILTILIVI